MAHENASSEFASPAHCSCSSHGRRRASARTSRSSFRPTSRRRSSRSPPATSPPSAMRNGCRRTRSGIRATSAGRCTPMARPGSFSRATDSGSSNRRASFGTRGVRGSGIGLSLCGLVPVLNAGSSSFQPWQGLRGLGELTIPDAFSTRARVIEFKATSADVCRPTTGQAFEIDLTREVNNRLGLVPTSSKRRERYSCNVGDAVPAASLGVALEGSAIKVTCQRRTNDDPPIALEYAFVEPIATYLIVKSVNGDFKTNSAYKSLEFPATN